LEELLPLVPQGKTQNALLSGADRLHPQLSGETSASFQANTATTRLIHPDWESESAPRLESVPRASTSP
jgi:hypothetical protein